MRTCLIDGTTFFELIVFFRSMPPFTQNLLRLLSRFQKKVDTPIFSALPLNHSLPSSPPAPMNPHLNFGYCCENWELHKQHGIWCARTIRLPTFKANGVEYARNIALQNVRDLATLIKWNRDHDIKVFRVSSDMFPMASHPDCVYPIDFAQAGLEHAGKLAREFKQRLTMHPSQHHVLTANKDSVLRSSIIGLEHHADILDRMGMDKQSVVVIHGGGVYGDKPAALARLEQNILALKGNVRDRLVLENCEMAYSIEDLLPISKKLLIPIVVDFHHDAIKPSSKPPEDYLEEVFAVWDARGIKPKVHISQSDPGVTEKDDLCTRRKHSDLITKLPEVLLNTTRDLDVMFEAKMKEESIFQYMELQGVSRPKPSVVTWMDDLDSRPEMLKSKTDSCDNTGPAKVKVEEDTLEAKLEKIKKNLQASPPKGRKTVAKKEKPLKAKRDVKTEIAEDSSTLEDIPNSKTAGTSTARSGSTKLAKNSEATTVASEESAPKKRRTVKAEKEDTVSADEKNVPEPRLKKVKTAIKEEPSHDSVAERSPKQSEEVTEMLEEKHQVLKKSKKSPKTGEVSKMEEIIEGSSKGTVETPAALPTGVRGKTKTKKLEPALKESGEEINTRITRSSKRQKAV